MTEATEELCDQCGHPRDPHKVVTTSLDADPLKGGVMLCHVEGCLCYATWALPQLGGSRDTVRVPDERELAEIRRMVQGA